MVYLFCGFADALFCHSLFGFGLSAFSDSRFYGGLLCGLFRHNFFRGCLLGRGLLGSFLRGSFFSGFLGRRLLCSFLGWSFLCGLFRRRFLRGLFGCRLLDRRNFGLFHNDDYGFFNNSLIIVRGSEYGGGFDFFVFLVKVFIVIGVQFLRLTERIAVTHCIHPEHFVHPIASSGRPLTLIWIAPSPNNTRTAHSSQ